MVNVEELDPQPFIAIMDRIGLSTDYLELQPGSETSFNGDVGTLDEEIVRATATVTVAAAIDIAIPFASPR